MRISASEQVRLLPIVMNPFHVEEVQGLPEDISPQQSFKGASGCYIGDLWTPLCYPIRGRYNDYGSIDNVPEETEKDKSELNQFIEAFKKYCIPLEVGENKYHDVSLKDFTLTEILEALQEGRCFVNYHSDLPQYKDRLIPISWMMIKESVWQSLLSIDVKKSGEVWERKDEPDRLSAKGIRAGLAKLVGRAMSRQRQEELMKKAEAKEITKEEVNEILESLCTQIGDSYTRRWVWNMSPIDAPELTNDLLDVASEMEYVHMMLGILRINYAPTTGSGSQCDNYKLWKMVNRSWMKIIDTDLKKKAIEDKKWRAEYKKIQAKQ